MCVCVQRHVTSDSVGCPPPLMTCWGLQQVMSTHQLLCPPSTRSIVSVWTPHSGMQRMVGICICGCLMRWWCGVGKWSPSASLDLARAICDSSHTAPLWLTRLFCGWKVGYHCCFGKKGLPHSIWVSHHFKSPIRSNRIKRRWWMWCKHQTTLTALDTGKNLIECSAFNRYPLNFLALVSLSYIVYNLIKFFPVLRWQKHFTPTKCIIFGVRKGKLLRNIK